MAERTTPGVWAILLAVLGPVAAGLILEYIRTRRPQEITREE